MDVATYASGAAGSTPAKRRVWSLLQYVLMALLAVIFMFPWFWTAMTSLKKTSELFTFPPLWFPAQLQFSNYASVFEQVPFGRWFLNTLFVVTLFTAGTVLTSSLAAYGFSRFEWPGRDIVFALTLCTMMLPSQVTLIPRYLIFKELQWLNTMKPLWIPAWFGGGAFSIFLLRQFLMSLPREYDEAATIDGANPFHILTTVLAPLMKPVLATVGVITLIECWNDFMDPLIYLASPEKFTIALGLRYFDATPAAKNYGMPTQHYLMACCVMSAAPVIALFFLAQRYFVQGVVMSGLKG